jgi:uncharacterized membrane protein YfcA
VCVVCFATGAAASLTLAHVTAIEWWGKAAVCAAFAVLGQQLAVRLTTRYFRPVLHAYLETSGQRAT